MIAAPAQSHAAVREASSHAGTAGSAQAADAPGRLCLQVTVTESEFINWYHDTDVPVQQGGPVLARMWQAALAGSAEHGPATLRWLDARVDAAAAAHNLTQVWD